MLKGGALVLSFRGGDSALFGQPPFDKEAGLSLAFCAYLVQPFNRRLRAVGICPAPFSERGGVRDDEIKEN
ncbi:MAG: hypothetical protein COT36_00630 [Parcubacteria group bacterium CG08_land_8_20_14_0_20_38_56]|nr:MAG: hypothetical protein COT36_00630 [Parcubacteria group bacterium CG08_land_8_20_14_0_20_38_56]